MKKAVFLILAGTVLASCSTQSQLYNWKNYDDAVYSYTKAPDEKSVENLIEVYTQLIENSGGSRKVPPPGVCADYGYLLLQEGKIEEGKALLQKETMLYPESKRFIDRILARFE